MLICTLLCWAGIVFMCDELCPIGLLWTAVQTISHICMSILQLQASYLKGPC